MTALAIGAGAAILGTGFQVFNGLNQESKANKIEKSLRDPTYNIPSEFYANREIARQMALQGLPQQVINTQTNRINQNQAGAIAALNNSANPGAGVSSVVRQGNQAGDALAAEDAQARENNQRYFINQNSAVGGQKLQKQQSDVFDKYTRDFNQMQAYRGAGEQNLNTGFQDLTSLGGMALNSALNPNSSSTGQPNYKNINGTWHVQDATGSWQPMIGNIPYGGYDTNSNSLPASLPGIQ